MAEPQRLTILDDYQHVALTSADWSAVQRRYEIDVVHEWLPDEDALVDRVADSSVVVAMRERTPFPAAVLDRLPELRLLVTTGAANASFDLDAAARNGVTVCGTGSLANSVPELTFGMIIALTRNFVAEDTAVRSGGWQHTIGPSLGGRTLGVIGLGRLGARVAELGRAFAMRVLAWSPSLTDERAAASGAERASLPQLLRESDVVTVHVPLNDASRGLIGAAELASMKRSAYLVNTSRGPIVDEAALLAALQDETIAGAALDVYDREPLPAHHPLRSAPNSLLLPHLGYVTSDTYAIFYGDAVADVEAFDAGAPVRVIAAPSR